MSIYIYIYSVAWVCEPTSGARPTQLRRCARASPHFPSGSVFIFHSAYPISPRSGERGFHFFIPTRYSFCSLALPVQFHRVGGSVVSVFFPKCEHKLGRHAVAFFASTYDGPDVADKTDGVSLVLFLNRGHQ